MVVGLAMMDLGCLRSVVGVHPEALSLSRCERRVRSATIEIVVIRIVIARDQDNILL
jgi:hypothetical protein